MKCKQNEMYSKEKNPTMSAVLPEHPRRKPTIYGKGRYRGSKTVTFIVIRKA
jgi:hypothetical protein